MGRCRERIGRRDDLSMEVAISFGRVQRQRVRRKAGCLGALASPGRLCMRRSGCGLKVEVGPARWKMKLLAPGCAGERRREGAVLITAFTWLVAWICISESICSRSSCRGWLAPPIPRKRILRGSKQHRLAWVGFRLFHLWHERSLGFFFRGTFSRFIISSFAFSRGVETN